MSEQMTLQGIPNVISSPALADGHLRSELPESPGRNLYGLVAPPARITPSPPQSMAVGAGSMAPDQDLPTSGSTSLPPKDRKASSSKTSPESTRGLRKSPAVWDSLATEFSNPNDRLRMLVRLIYAGECGLLPTLVARDYRSPGDPNHPRRSATRGQPLPETFSSPIPAELARWMMGFPAEWAQCMPTEMPSTRGRQPKQSGA